MHIKPKESVSVRKATICTKIFVERISSCDVTETVTIRLVLSIIIPTLKFSEYFERALGSALDAAPPNSEIIVSHNGSNLSSYQSSVYANHELVSWFQTDEDKPIPLHESLNFAAAKASNDFIFFLSDDDVLMPTFLRQPEILLAGDNSLTAIRHAVINQDGLFLRFGRQPQKRILRGEAIFHSFVKDEFRYNLSLFVIPKRLFWDSGGFTDCGYPNGYFVDTVLFGKLMARCDTVIIDQTVSLLRRESVFQGSSQFYVDKRARGFLTRVANNLFEDEAVNEKITLFFKDRQTYLRELAKRRFLAEWKKAQMPHLAKSIGFKASMLLWFWFYWPTSLKSKVGLTYHILFPTWKNWRLFRQLGNVTRALFQKTKANRNQEPDFTDYRIAELKNKHLGERCFVIGNGPSLSTSDLDRIKDEVSFAANRIDLCFVDTAWRPTYYSIIDSLVWEKIRTKLHYDIHEVFTTKRCLPLDPKYAVPNVVPMLSDQLYKGKYRGSLDATAGLFHTMSVTHFNIQLAMHMGFSDIILLGVDHSYAGEEKKTSSYEHEPTQQNHFSASYRQPGELVAKAPIEYMTWGFSNLRLMAEENRIQIVNATRGGNLEVFDRVDLETLL